MKRSDSSLNKGGSVATGVLLLSLSTVLVKIIGLAYKIPMISLLGAEGMGYFNSAYEIYALLCIIATAGLPIALSMRVSVSLERGERAEISHIYRSAMALFVAIGTIGGAVMLTFADSIARWLENPFCAPAIRAISPALLCICVSSAVRGYFQGFGKMLPSAISQLIEALGKLILGVFFAKWARDAGYDVATSAAFGILGVSVGTLLSLVYLLALKHRNDKRERAETPGGVRAKSGEGSLGSLLRIAIPITLSSAILGVTRLADMALIMRRLQDIGYSAAGANVIYGSYTTLAVPIFNLLPSLIAPIALAVVVKLSAAIESGSVTGAQKILSVALRISVLFSMPASLAIAVYSPQILGLLFSGSADAISIAAPLLSILGASVLFSCLITTTNAILQAYGRATVPMIAMSVGAALKIISAYILIGIDGIGAYGAPISTLICDLTITAINFYYINKCTKESVGVARLYLRPLAASLSMITVSFAGYILLQRLGGGESISFIFAAALGVIAYVFFSLAFGAIEREDIIALPLGERILDILERCKIYDSKERTK